MTALNHTPHGWRWFRVGMPGDAHLLGDHGRRPVVLGAGGRGFLVQRDAETGLLVPFDPLSPDGLLIANATEAPHDCEHEGCPGRENKRIIQRYAQVLQLLLPDYVEGDTGPADALRRKLAALDQLGLLAKDLRDRLLSWREGYRAFSPGGEEPADPAQALRDLAERLRVAEARVAELEGA